MRIPFPERIPLDRVAAFGLVFFAIQLLEGTAIYFSVGTLAFLILATLAFNVAGGLTRASGAYVFFYAMLDFLIGVFYKAMLGEPADSNLQDPQSTIAVFAGGMAAMLIAVLIARRLSRRTGLLENLLIGDRMYRATIGCLLFGIGGPVMLGFLGSVRLESAFTQLNNLVPLAIILGTMYEVRRSGGTRSLNIAALIGIIYSFLIFGVLGFSKQGLLTSVYCWAVTICATRYRLTTLQFFSCILWIVIVFEILVPYSQYGRRYINSDSTTSDRIKVAERLLAEPLFVRNEYKKEELESPPPEHYFNQAEGFMDRLTFVSVDDALINVTDNGHVFGYLPIIASFGNAIPHIFYPNKPVYNFGNAYAHEIGGLPDEDNTTGISFSPTSELYHLGRWTALLTVGPLCWTLLFVVLDSLCGDLRKTPWGLLALTMISHVAPETGIEGVIYMATFGTEILTFCAIFATYVAPIIATAALGEPRKIPVPFQGRTALTRLPASPSSQPLS